MPSRLRHDHLAQIVEASHDAIIVFWLDGTIIAWNKAAERLYGYTVEEAVGASMLMLVPPERHEYWRTAAARLGQNVAFAQYETQRVRKDGALLDISMTVTPLLDENGKVFGASTIARDVTEQKKTLAELTMRLMQQEVVAVLGAEALQSEELDPLFDLALERLVETLAVDFAKIVEKRPGTDQLFLRAGRGWRNGGVGTASIPGNLGSQASYVLASEAPVIVEDLKSERRFRAPPLFIEHGVVSGMSTLVAGPGREPFGVLGVHTRERRTFTSDDINFLQSVANVLASAVQRFHDREARELLLRELRHRIGNQFVQILALHQQTARHSKNIDELVEKFHDRVLAISSAHSVLAQADGENTDLRALLHSLLVAYRDKAELEGDPIPLTADESFILALALNELVMNASKYGCFRDADGRLSVTWRQRPVGQGKGFGLEWREDCNGSHIAEPKETGFGTKLIDMMVRSSLHGTVRRRFEPNGLLLELEVPLADARTGASAIRADEVPPPPA